MKIDKKIDSKIEYFISELIIATNYDEFFEDFRNIFR